VTGKNDHERGSANISLSRTLIEMYEFENAGLTLDQVVLYSPMRGDFYSTMFVYLLATGKVKQAVDLIDPVRASFIPEVPLGSFPPRSSSVIGTFRPLFYLVATLVGQGFSSDLIFNCITQPPSDLLPETPEYMEWWRKQLHKPGWLPTTMRFAEMLALGEQLLEEDPSTKLMLHEELKNSLLWLFSAETVAESKNLLPGLPHLTLSPHGELVAEWWGADEKKLTFYLSPSEKYYLRSWGPHIDEQMQDGDLESVEHGASQIYWLRGTDNV
jgi:hypothetical protein